MLDRLSGEARLVVVQSEAEARGLRHDQIGPAHILLALLGSQQTTAGQLLTSFGLGLAETRGLVHGLAAAASSPVASTHGNMDSPGGVAGRRGRLRLPNASRAHGSPRPRRRRGRGDDRPRAAIPFGADAKKVVEAAMWEARILRHSVITPEHLLLGMLRIRDALVHQVLTATDCTESALRQRTMSDLAKQRGS